MSTRTDRHQSAKARIGVLAAQAFALGLTMAWIMIPASAIFLEAYGPDLLPVTYIGAAVAGIVASTLLGTAFRRRPLAAVAIQVLAGLAILLFASWTVLSLWDADWVSFALLVVFPIGVPVGFVFVVGQAGMLLDVRALKALYARVVAGFALGFVTGGLAGPLLLVLLHGTKNLLLAASAAATLFLALLVTTRRRYPSELSVVGHAEGGAEIGTDRPTLRTLTGNRYVVLIVAFQMLSAVESQWLDFLVFDNAAQRYHDRAELARFVSRFSAIAYGTDVVFLLVLAGFLLHRFGLRYGLTVNPIGVLAMLGSILVAAALHGMGTTIVFALIVAARVTDLTFSDGASRTSLSAAYQAVPHRLRAIAQAMVEGLAVPVAIGLSGVVLLALRSYGGTDGVVLPVLTALVVFAWVLVATFMYREYRVSLLANLRGRALDPAELAMEGDNLAVVERLVGSEHERDVRLGLDVLTIAEHPGLALTLERLAADERDVVRADALERLARLAPDRAVVAARAGVDAASPAVRVASIRILGAAGDASDCAAVTAHAGDTAPAMELAVVFALTRIGDAAARERIAADIAGLAVSGSAAERTRAALLVAETAPSARDPAVLRALLSDPDSDVVNAALAAVRPPADDAFRATIVGALACRATAGAAVDAIVRLGDAALPIVDDGLRDGGRRRSQELLVRAAREIGGPPAIVMLRRHVEHHDREVGLAVMAALAALADGPGTTEAGPEVVEATVIGADLEHAARVLRALVAFAETPAAAPLLAALRDELDLLRKRVLAALSMHYGTDEMNRVVFQLSQRDRRSHALALEWLDVTLTGAGRAVVALLEPGVPDQVRMDTLTRRFPVEPLPPHEVLLDLVEDRGDVWRRPWITACALYAAAGVRGTDGGDRGRSRRRAAAANSAALLGADEEASIVEETLAGIRGRRAALG